MRNFKFDEIKKKKTISKVVENGEVTGHKHVVDENGVLYKSLEDDCLLLKVLDKSNITHEEHKKINLLPGNYKKKNVREYDHIKEEARKVDD